MRKFQLDVGTLVIHFISFLDKKAILSSQKTTIETRQTNRGTLDTHPLTLDTLFGSHEGESCQYAVWSGFRLKLS